uniref:Uncharacterized protein n=1 Tax=Candidatus Kentrum sp. SD TaxID=2126332 RepID=A0A450YA70_9GAMM|nr:MAG: hypothetical protein BECKSD772F_GA0070984_102410 [Candidatus Kentron sp. SD]VFK43520.1 MAG: hypothetical protein BECKSD772E_GA0070983_102626 [Candidatus Kentron sp. SD]VFK79581.1 MAG: hypothetical protein BECKSD772D_GA0070982_105515 [Candidatus Kentron sp. SD]
MGSDPALVSSGGGKIPRLNDKITKGAPDFWLRPVAALKILAFYYYFSSLPGFAIIDQFIPATDPCGAITRGDSPWSILRARNGGSNPALPGSGIFG